LDRLDIVSLQKLRQSLWTQRLRAQEQDERLVNFRQEGIPVSDALAWHEHNIVVLQDNILAPVAKLKKPLDVHANNFRSSGIATDDPNVFQHRQVIASNFRK